MKRKISDEYIVNLKDSSEVKDYKKRLEYNNTKIRKIGVTEINEDNYIHSEDFKEDFYDIGSMAGKNILSWEADEFVKYKKSSKWFAIFSLIIGLFVIWSVAIGNFLFTAVIIVSAFLIYIYTLKQPKKVLFSITSRGVLVDKKFYDFDDLSSFWIFYNPPFKELILNGKKKLFLKVEIPLGDFDPVKIRSTLSKFLPEEKEEYSLIKLLAHYFRF